MSQTLEQPTVVVTSDDSPAISIRGASKSFRIPIRQATTLKELVLHPRSNSYRELHTFNKLDLDIPKGEFFGIVGRNGSGKSTLLKCLAGIYRLNEGEIKLEGRLAPFLELGVGFNPELTARDNVVINASMLGLSRREARKRFDEIIEFAGLEDFIDLKLKNYSSGMAVRLAFSVAVQVDADVLLVDEVLAVGDSAFQIKCFKKFEELKAAGKTVIFVTHDMSSVERFCERVMVIEKGEVVMIGDPYQAARTYHEINFGQLDGGQATQGDARISRCWVEDSNGQQINAADHGVICTACIEWELPEPADTAEVELTMRNEMGHCIYRMTSTEENLSANETMITRFQFQNWFAPNRYAFSPTITTTIHGNPRSSSLPDSTYLLMQNTDATGGVIDLPFDSQTRPAKSV